MGGIEEYGTRGITSISNNILAWLDHFCPPGNRNLLDFCQIFLSDEIYFCLCCHGVWFGGTAVVCVAGPLPLLLSSPLYLPIKGHQLGPSVVGPHSSPHLTSPAINQILSEFLAVGGAVAPGWTLPLTCGAWPAFMIIAVVEWSSKLFFTKKILFGK